MLSHFSVKRAKHYIPNWFNCFIVRLFRQIQASIILKKASKINAVMERKNSNCVVILTDQGKLKLLQTLVNTFFLIYCPQGTKQRLGYHNKILCKTKEDKYITGQMKNYSADLPDVPKKPGVWFDVSWKRLYLHDLLSYFFNSHTSN